MGESWSEQEDIGSHVCAESILLVVVVVRMVRRGCFMFDLRCEMVERRVAFSGGRKEQCWVGIIKLCPGERSN